VEANKMCMDDMMAIDAKAAWANHLQPGVRQLTLIAPASITDPGRKYVASMCSVATLATDYPVVN
jgi:hypothetical protein